MTASLLPPFLWEGVSFHDLKKNKDKEEEKEKRATGFGAVAQW